MLTTTKALKEASCLQVYLGAIDALNDSHFDMNTKAFFRHSLQKKDEQTMTALAVYLYYQDTRSKVQNQVLPFFPKDLVSMKSGCGFHESCNEVYISTYRKGLLKKCSKEKADQMLLHLPFEITRPGACISSPIRFHHFDVIIRSHILILGVDPTVKQYASTTVTSR